MRQTGAESGFGDRQQPPPPPPLLSEGSPPRVARFGSPLINSRVRARRAPRLCVCPRTTKPRAQSSTVATGAAERRAGERGERQQTEDGRTRSFHAALPGSAPDMQSLISPVTKAILVALFIFAILLILYVILWYICRDVDCDHGI